MTGTRAFERRRSDVVAGLVGLSGLAICGFIVRDGSVGSFERSIFESLNGLPDALEPPMRIAQLLGVLVVGPITAIVASALRRWRLAAAALLVTLGKLAAERIVWQLVSRQRPGVTEPNAIVRGGTPTTGAAFVSGHVILLTALAWVLAPYLRGGWRLAPWIVVALVSFTRIYLGAHNPLDVLGGICLGTAVGCAARLIVAVPSPEKAGTAERPGLPSGS
jgi:membrane-associated phospholipid phosphatase